VVDFISYLGLACPRTLQVSRQIDRRPPLGGVADAFSALLQPTD